MSLCDSCRYQYYVEQLKPCIIRRDDCEFYESCDACEHSDEIDFIQPKKTVGKLISADVLDKIRAEIDKLDVLRYASGERIYKDEVIDIIDKYRESEK